MKIITLFFSFFVSLLNSMIKFQEDKVEYPSYIEENYEIHYLNDFKEIYYQNKLIKTINKNENIKIFTVEDQLYIFSYDNINNNIVLESYDKTGKIIFTKELDNPLISSFDCLYYDNYFYLVSGINQYTNQLIKEKYEENSSYLLNTNAIILKINLNGEIEDVDIKGGILNEYYYSLKLYNDKLYLIAYKDTLSGYDFGNGGNDEYGYIITCYDLDLNMINYITLQDQKILTFTITNQFIYIISEKQLYCFDLALNNKFTFKFALECSFASISINKSFLVANLSEWKIYDLELLNIIDEGTFSNNNEESNEEILEDILEIGNNIYIKTNNNYYNLTIYDISSFHDYVIFDNNDNYYNNIILSGELIVLEEENVRNDMIYPLGYSLKFTGTAYLNNQMIVNNHRIQEEGDYNLDLYDCNNKKRSFHFQVKQGQIQFQEKQNKQSDFEIFSNESVILEYRIKSSFSMQIDKIIINDNIYDNYTLENDLLTIYFSQLNPGINQFVIETISCKSSELENNEMIYTIPIHKWLRINVLEDPIKVHSTFKVNKKDITYEVSLDDQNNLSRGFLFVSKQNSYFFLMNQSEIIFNNLSIGETYLFDCYFIADYGGTNLEQLHLLRMEIIPSDDNISLGEIQMNQKEESVEKFSLVLDKTKQLSKVYQDEQIIYKYSSQNIIGYIIVGIFLGGIIFCIAVFLKKNKKKMKLKKAK